MALLATVALMMSLATSASAAQTTTVSAIDARRLAAVAREHPRHAPLSVEGLRLDHRQVTLELERHEVFSPDARLVADDGTRRTPLTVPDVVYLRGFVAGETLSSALLVVTAQGQVRGVVHSAGRTWSIGSQQGGLTARALPASAQAAVECGVGSASGPNEFASQIGIVPPAAAALQYTARVAVETDFEFFSKFGDSQQALAYIGEIFAFASGLYEAEVGTTLQVSDVTLWTNANDPWTAVDNFAALSQFRDFWSLNRGGVDRTVAHFLSGKQLGGGVAYTATLCDDQRAYSLSDDIHGDYEPGDGIVYDTLLVAHELGHSFGSPHTHCYNGLGGSEPVDQCWRLEPGCYSGSVSLPCAQGPGAACGTIMSYCYAFPGGLGNIAMTLGLGHPYGTEPDRVPSRMAAYAAQIAAGNPACLTSDAPTSPVHVEASDGAFTDRVRVRWIGSGAATSYRVYRKTTNSSSGSKLIGSPAAPPFDDMSADTAATYWYFVKAVHAAGESDYSGGDSGFRSAALSPPAVPANVEASDQGYVDTVRVRWDGSGTAAGYKVFRNTSDASSGAVLLAQPPVSYYDDSSALAGRRYWYFVSATNGAGDSAFSNRDVGHFACGEDAACSDGNYCNGAEDCVAGFCEGAAPPCPGADGDGNCKESCDEAADSCAANDADGSSCSDGLSCTSNDSCNAGICTGTPGCAECGNSAVEAGEACDDGDTIFHTGDGCRSDCTRTSCGVPSGAKTDKPTATDALMALRAAVGGLACVLPVCDVDQSGGVNTSDALRILRVAVGQALTLSCPA